MPEQRSHRILVHGDESSNHGRKVLDDTATQRPATHGAIARGWGQRQSKCLDEAEVRGREIYECAERDMALGSTPRW